VLAVQSIEAQTIPAHAMSDDLLGRFPWYDARLKRVMFAYALGADDVLQMYEIFHHLDYKDAGSIRVTLLLESWVSTSASPM